MALNKIGTRIVVEGEKEYRSAMNACKTALKAMNSELSLVTTQFGKNANSLEALKKKQEAYLKIQAEQQKKIELLNNVQKKAVSVLDDERKKLETSAKERDDLNKKLDEARKKYGENSDEVKELSEQLNKSNAEYNKQADSVQKLENKINNWQTELNKAQQELIQTNDAIQKNEKYLGEADKAYDKTAHSIDKYGKEVENAKDKTNDFWKMAGSYVTADAIIGVVQSIGREFVELGKTVVEVGSSFEASMSQVAATMALSQEEIHNNTGAYKILSDVAKEMGRTTKYTASEAAEALNYLALAGYDAEKAASALPTVLNLASAGGMDLAYASDLATDSMAALGLETTQLENFTDQLAKTSQKSNTSVAQLGEAILTVGGTAKQLKGGVVEMNTVLGILADNGIKGAEGGTMLRNVLENLTSPTDKASKALENLGVNVFDKTNGSMRSLNDIFIELGHSLDGLTDEERAQKMNAIFDARVLKGAEAIIGNAGKRYEELAGYISDCNGAAEQMAITMNDNLKGRSTELNSALEGLGITIYNSVEEPLKKATETSTTFVSELNNALTEGELGEALAELGGTIEDNVVSLLELANDAIPSVIDGITLFVEAYNKIQEVYESIPEWLIPNTPIDNFIDQVRGAFDVYSYGSQVVSLFRGEQEQLNETFLSSNGIEVVIEKTAELGNAVSTTGGEVTALSDELVEAYSDMQESIQKSIEGSMNLFDKFTNESVVPDTETIKSNLKSQIDGYNEWGNNFDELASRTDVAVNQQILAYLANLGIEGAGYVKEFKEMSASEFTEIQDLMLEALSVPTDVSTQISSDWLQIASKVPESAAQGISENTDAVKSATEDMTKEIEFTLDASTKSKGSKGSKFLEFGKNLIMDLSDGISDNQDIVVEKSETLTKDTVSVFDKNLGSQKFVSIGENVGSGLASGILSKKSDVIRAAEEISAAAEKASRNRLQIKSPSRVFASIGEYTGEGFISGWESKTKDIVDSVNDTMSQVTNVNVEGFDISNGGQSELLTQIFGLLQAHLPSVGNNQIMLDTGVLVGATAPMMNTELGRISAREGMR